MNYIIKVKTHRDEIEVRLKAIDADDAVGRFKLLTKEFIIKEIYPESETGTKLQDSFSPDFTKLNKVGLEAEPYIPDSVRNKLLLAIARTLCSLENINGALYTPRDCIDKVKSIMKFIER